MWSQSFSSKLHYDGKSKEVSSELGSSFFLFNSKPLPIYFSCEGEHYDAVLKCFVDLQNFTELSINTGVDR